MSDIDEVMIDIETTSTENNAMILTIGAIKFNRLNTNKKLNEMESFYKRVFIPFDDEEDFDVSNKTIEWWSTQNEDAFYEAFANPDRIQLENALEKLKDFIPTDSLVWANSPQFDCVILENAFRYYNIDIPWSFWNLRDLRTIMDVSSMKHNDFIHLKKCDHNSLHDCHYQISVVKECYNRILRKH